MRKKGKKGERRGERKKEKKEEERRERKRGKERERQREEEERKRREGGGEERVRDMNVKSSGTDQGTEKNTRHHEHNNSDTRERLSGGDTGRNRHAGRGEGAREQRVQQERYGPRRGGCF